MQCSNSKSMFRSPNIDHAELVNLQYRSYSRDADTALRARFYNHRGPNPSQLGFNVYNERKRAMSSWYVNDMLSLSVYPPRI